MLDPYLLAVLIFSVSSEGVLYWKNIQMSKRKKSYKCRRRKRNNKVDNDRNNYDEVNKTVYCWRLRTKVDDWSPQHLVLSLRIFLIIVSSSNNLFDLKVECNKDSLKQELFLIFSFIIFSFAIRTFAAVFSFFPLKNFCFSVRRTISMVLVVEDMRVLIEDLKTIIREDLLY